MLTESQQIDEIYKVYPRKVAPRAAKMAIAKAVVRIAANGSTLENARRWLWKKTKEYASSPAGQKPPDLDHEFRPHPTTWFNQDRFFDDPAEWQKPNGGKTNGNGKTGSNFDALRKSLAEDQNGARGDGVPQGRKD
jgi:hypothetical protein